MNYHELRERNRRRDRIYGAALGVAIIVLVGLVLWAGHTLGMRS